MVCWPDSDSSVSVPPPYRQPKPFSWRIARVLDFSWTGWMAGGRYISSFRDVVCGTRGALEGVRTACGGVCFSCLALVGYFASRGGSRGGGGGCVAETIAIRDGMIDVLLPNADHRQVAPYMPPGAPILSVSKGIETSSLMLMNDILKEACGPERSYAFLR